VIAIIAIETKLSMAIMESLPMRDPLQYGYPEKISGVRNFSPPRCSIML